MRRTSAIASLLTTVLLLGAACARDTEDGGDASGKPTYKIAFMGDITGANKSLMIAALNTGTMMVDRANADDEMPVRLEFAPFDTQGDKDRAKTVVADVVRDDKIIALLGPGFSGESETTGDDLEAAGIPRITPSATTPTLAQRGWKLWWRALGNDSQQGDPTPEVIFDYVKAAKVFIGHDGTTYGANLATIVREGVIKKNKSALAGFEGVEPGQEDYGPLVTKVIASKADAFYWGAYEKEAGLIVKQLRERGFQGRFLGADGSKGADLLKVGGERASGALLTCPCADPTTSEDPEAKSYVDEYRKRFGEAPTIYGGEAFDSMKILIEMIKEAGVPSDMAAYRQKIAEQIRNLKGFKGITKAYTFQPNGELVPEAVKIYLYEVKDGNFVLVGAVDDLLGGGSSAGASGTESPPSSPAGG